MPSNLFMSDVSFPKFEKGQSSEEKFNMILNYLHMMQEQLRYALGNVGVNNFNEAEIDSLGRIINQPVILRLEDTDGKLINLDATVEGLIVKVKDEAEERESSISQLADSIKLEVKNSDGEPASITLRVDGEKKGSVDLTGLVTFRSLSDPDSDTEIDGGHIKTGTITGVTLNGCHINCFTDTNISGSSSVGDISFYDEGTYGTPKVCCIKFINVDTLNNELLIETDDSAAGRNYNIRLKSAGKLYLDSEDGIYINGVSLEKYISNSVGSVVAVFG